MGVLLSAQPSSGQSMWTSPVALSEPGFFAWFPDITADPYGIVHLVFASGYQGFDEVFYMNSSDGQTWSKQNDIFAMPWVGTNSAATRPSLMVDRHGHLNISFVDLTTVYYSRVSVSSGSKVSAWAPKQTISGGQIAYFSKMALDSKNIIHFIFSQNTPSDNCPICYHLYYRYSKDDGTSWAPAVDIIPGALGAVKPQLMVDRNDNLHLVWESGRGGGLGQLTNPTSVSYTSSKDGGKTWSAPQTLSRSADENAKNITIGQDRLGNLVVVYWSRAIDQIVYRVSTDGGNIWSAASPIPDILGAAAVYASNLDDYSVAADSNGDLHVAAIGRLSGSTDTLNIFDLVWDGYSWAKPDVIATYKNDVPEWPRITVSQGNQLYVTWFVRDAAHIFQENGVYQVWYSKKTASSPSVNTLPIPTAGSVPTKVLTTTVKQTTTPTPALIETSDTAFVRRSGTTPSSEAEMLPFIAAMLIPSLLLLFGAAIYVSRRR
jgi:hypothetical protein